MDKKFGVGEYRTRSGQLARVEFVMREPCVDGDVSDPLVGQIQRDSGEWEFCSWSADGSFGEDRIQYADDLTLPTKTKYKAFDSYGQAWGFQDTKEEAVKIGHDTAFVVVADFDVNSRKIIPTSLRLEMCQ